MCHVGILNVQAFTLFYRKQPFSTPSKTSLKITALRIALDTAKNMATTLTIVWTATNGIYQQNIYMDGRTVIDFRQMNRCLYFQATGTCERSTCTVSHKCVNCSGDHPAKDCAVNAATWLTRTTSAVGISSTKDDHYDDKRDRDHRDRDRDREYRDSRDKGRDRDYRDSVDNASNSRESNDRWSQDRNDDVGSKRKLDAEKEEEIRIILFQQL